MSPRILIFVIALVCTTGASAAAGVSAMPSSSVFVGTTPAGDEVRAALGLPESAKDGIVVWQLTLNRRQPTGEPNGYALRASYGVGAPGLPGLRGDAPTIERQGAWRLAPSDVDAPVMELDGIGAFAVAGTFMLQKLDRNGRLMVGTGGWSYTLNDAHRAEPAIDEAAQRNQVERSYQLAPLATGSGVYGVFEGRTPCQGVARELGIRVEAACTKVKWRLTLMRDVQTQKATTYRLEGGFFGDGAREGLWSQEQGRRWGPKDTVVRLAPAGSQPALYLLKGDDNVLFFLDGERTALVGNRDFSYTLNRRSE